MFHNEDPNSDMPTTERIPSVLMAPYLGKGHMLYTDNWYTSPTLATFLLSNKTYLCATVKSNGKHFPIVNRDTREYNNEINLYHQNILKFYVRKGDTNLIK